MPKVIQAIESEVLRGNGRDEVLRAVATYHTLDGEFLAERDPCPNGRNVPIPQEALDWLNGEHTDGFEKPAGAKGEFWWRSEFRRRAKLGS